MSPFVQSENQPVLSNSVFNFREQAGIQVMPTLDPIQLNTLSKLLLNSWSAEYALRLTPLTNHEADLETLSRWTFPQIYYSALFSARAVLLTFGNWIANPFSVQQAMGILANYDFYGKGFTDKMNPYQSLDKHQITENKDLIKALIDADLLTERHQGLVDKINSINLIHERHIMKSIGREKYCTIVRTAPAYLSDAFIGARLTLLLAENTGNDEQSA